jgi:YesN/AraC family two-component response regulator
MIIDDDKLIVHDLLHIVDWKSLGFEVVATAHNGKQGLLKYEELMPDVIFSDIRMPIMGGLEMINQIREKDNNVKIVLLTAYGEFGYAQQAIGFGVCEYILKNELTQDLMTNTLERIKAKVLSSDAQRAPDSKRCLSPAISRVISYIEENYSSKDLNIRKISDAVCISPSWLSVRFRNETGQTVNEYITSVRMREAKKLLRQDKYKIYEVATKVGYGSGRYFSRVFLQTTGHLPLSYGWDVDS